jgi:hypothetical protein
VKAENINSPKARIELIAVFRVVILMVGSAQAQGIEEVGEWRGEGMS